MSTQGLQDQIDQLQQQLDQLQQQLADATIDSLSPSYLTLDAEGHVSANFNGFLHALGIELPTYLSSGVASQSFIKWTDPDNALLGGGIVIEYVPAGQMYTVIQANAEQAADLSQVNLQARDDTDTTRASLNVTQQDRGASSSVNAFAGNASASIIRQDDSSDFVRVVGSQVAVAVDVAPGADALYAIELGSGDLPANWQLLVQPVDGSFMDWLTWSVASSTANSVTIRFHNFAASAATGNVYVTILNLTNA